MYNRAASLTLPVICLAMDQAAVPNEVAPQAGCCVWFTGLSGAGKSTIADIVVADLRERGRKVELLDGDEVREHLSKGLGFSKADRDTNVLRIGWVAKVLARNGVVAVTAAISPYREVRDEVRGWIDNFVEVHVATALEDCEARDVKGLYAKARSGEIPEFTGVSHPYEPPLSPEIRIETAGYSPAESAAGVVSWLAAHDLA
jgi:adenylyl-sulfate kinase